MHSILDSAGLNLALDYLPGSVTSIRLPIGSQRTSHRASSGSTRHTMNVDRTARNTNILMWHRSLADHHGATLYFITLQGGSPASIARVTPFRWSEPCAARCGRLTRGGRCGALPGADCRGHRADSCRRTRRMARSRRHRWCRARLPGRLRPPPARTPAGAPRVRAGGRACPLNSPTTTQSSGSCRASSVAR